MMDGAVIPNRNTIIAAPVCVAAMLFTDVLLIPRLLQRSVLQQNIILEFPSSSMSLGKQELATEQPRVTTSVPSNGKPEI